MTTYDELFTLLVLSNERLYRRSPIDRSALPAPTEPTPFTRRGPGEYVLPRQTLTSAFHDSSIIDRALAILRQGIDKSSGNRGLTLLPNQTQLLLDHVLRRGMYSNSEDVGAGRFNEMIHRAIDPMIDELVHESEGSLTRLSRLRFPEHVHFNHDYQLVRWVRDDTNARGDYKLDEHFSTLSTQSFMANDLISDYHGIPSVVSVDRPGLGADLLDIRLVTEKGEQRILYGAHAIAAKVRAIKQAGAHSVAQVSVQVLCSAPFLVQAAIQIIFASKARFAIIWGLPYLVIFELIVLAFLMDHNEDYRIERHSEETEARLREYVQQVRPLLPIETQQSSVEVASISTAPDYKTSVTTPGCSDSSWNVNAARSSACRGGDSDNFSELTQTFVWEHDSIVEARHFSGRAIVCDARALPDSGMIAVPIDLDTEAETISRERSSSEHQPSPPAKKIRLDADQTKESKLVAGLPYKRLGRGASSVVWEGEWVQRSAACGSPSFFAGKGSPVAKVPASTPVPAHAISPVTLPPLFLDSMSTPFTSPTWESQLAILRDPSSAGVGPRKLAVKVVLAEFAPLIAKECFVYTSIVPLLSSRAPEHFPVFYGLYQSGTKGDAFIFVMEDAGSAIAHERVESDAELKARVDVALKLIADEGIVHNDEAARNVLLRPDGRICLIDWAEALLS
ncbi:BQ2448_1952 [Microbotryum intermedium]|uniref:BQ2448_1952 protein n=1 Tax=Microbotryum intermedium TaxID=269621 RepID=A0A238F4P4_9BASI|nr:BQ2448_1952 [Microbotryum intermedium]